ncbi:MAG: DTW domain-containing protein [Deltaproteobacteria bacterium]|nr:DTW domain-containing protein [Deltaproteobacteria bacterium]
MLEARPTCDRCLRPLGYCWCAHLSVIDTKTRIVFLQHPREAGVAIGTARMAHLCLPRSELHVGVHWKGSRALESVHADPTRPPALLYPGEGAIDVMREPPTHPITLVVIDGTWAQARKIANQNPELASLPRYAFTPPRASQYRIRAEPDERFVSTIEALSYVLGALEGEPERFQALLRPFEAMVDTQVEIAARERNTRVIGTPSPRVPRGAPRPRVLAERLADLVCVVAEPNAWPYGHPLRGTTDPGELVHLAAVRVATREVLDVIARPRIALAPNTALHLDLAESVFLEGESLASMESAWRSFLRPADLVCTWGSFTPKIAKKEGLAWPSDSIDLRRVARTLAQGSVGALEDVGARFSMSDALRRTDPPRARGRGGRRLALLDALVRTLASGP